MVFPLLGPILGAVGRGAIGGAIGRVGSGLARNFLGAFTSPSGQENYDRPANDNISQMPAAVRATSAGSAAATVDKISSLSNTMQGSNKERTDVGEYMGGSGTVVSLLASINRNMELMLASISNMGRANRSANARAGLFQQGSLGRDIAGLVGAGGLLAALGSEAPSERNNNNPAAGNQPSQPNQPSQAQPSTVNEVELSRIADVLTEPEVGETEEGRVYREFLQQRVVDEINNQPQGNSYNVPADVNQYLQERRAREQSQNNPGTVAPAQPPDPSRIEPAAPAQPPEPSSNEPQPTQPSEPSQNNQRIESSTPPASQRLQNTAAAITGSNTQQPGNRISNNSRPIASALDPEATQSIPMENVIPQSQAPTIINNNNIMQGGGGGARSQIAPQRESSAPAGTAVPPQIGIAPTPPSSPAFFNYN